MDSRLIFLHPNRSDAGTKKDNDANCWISWFELNTLEGVKYIFFMGKQLVQESSNTSTKVTIPSPKKSR